MSRIEDVVYEAYDLGLKDEVFSKVSTLKKKKNTSIPNFQTFMR